jgi:hypothetical protein
MALATSVHISSSTLVAQKPVRKVSNNVASLVSNKQFRRIFSIHVNEPNSQVTKVHWKLTMQEHAHFCDGGVAPENNRYILMVRGALSLKVSMDSAGRTISFSPV